MSIGVGEITEESASSYTVLNKTQIKTREDTIRSVPTGTNQVLAAISRYSEMHPELQKTPISWRYEIEEDNGVRIFNSLGKELTSIIPSKIKIVHTARRDKKFDAYVKNGVVYVDVIQANKLAIEGGTTIAHEIGHLLNPDYDILRKNEEIESQSLRQNGYIIHGGKRIDRTCNKISTNLEEEVQAWNYGKAVADFLGIDELNYESEMNWCLQTYFQAHLDNLRHVCEYEMYNKGSVKADKVIRLYNPLLQDFEEMPIQELIDFLNNNDPKKKLDRIMSEHPDYANDIETV